jgi:plastocyanin
MERWIFIMNYTPIKILIDDLRRVFSSPCLTTVVLTCILLASSALHAANQETGSVTGDIAVFTKKFFGGLKKAKDMSRTVVYITGFKAEAPAEIVDIKQDDKRFVPGLLPVVAGQQVRFPNQDKIYHNVFSISPLAQFDLGQYKNVDPPKIVTFDDYGVVTVYCNIHPGMIAYVVVLENSAFALTEKDGGFRINDLPPGTYTINAWRPKAKRASQQIIIQPGQNTEVHMEVKNIEKISPHRRKDGSRYPHIVSDGKRGSY